MEKEHYQWMSDFSKFLPKKMHVRNFDGVCSQGWSQPARQSLEEVLVLWWQVRQERGLGTGTEKGDD